MGLFDDDKPEKKTKKKKKAVKRYSLEELREMAAVLKELGK